MKCTRCDGTGFINLHQIPELEHDAIESSSDPVKITLEWIEKHENHDVSVCDCCGDGEGWYHDEPGTHEDTQFGMDGPYAYNGGLPECY